MLQDTLTSRRAFLKKLSLATGAAVLMPTVSRCGAAPAAPEPAAAATGVAEAGAAQVAEAPAAAATSMPTVAASPIDVPLTPPADWEPIAFNRARGNAGAIPATYLPDVNGPEGDAAHLGKHLPYVPEVDPSLVPPGMLAIMWGDPAKGHSKHPNAVRAEANNFEGHWYNWIRVRKATDGEAEELESLYPEWPGDDETGGGFAVLGEGAITDDAGKNTIYLAAIPSDCGPGDLVRVYAHCLTHGEYVDFIQL